MSSVFSFSGSKDWGDKSMNNDLRVDEYLFTTVEDATLAAEEKKKVAYLQKHMDMKVPQNVLAVYNKANRDRIFKTPVGHSYLVELRNYLLHLGVPEEKLDPIQLYANYEPKPKDRSESIKNRMIQAKRNELRKNLRISVLLNILLALAIVAMFAITLNSDNPNMLNYEQAIQNKYSAWEQELTEWEAELRERDRGAE